MNNHRVSGRLAIALMTLIALSVASCGLVPVAPKYQRPNLDLPKPAQSESPVIIDWLSWWKSFKDPVLDALLLEAASQSQDLIIASARIDEARATLNQNQVNFFPTVDFNSGLTQRRSSENAASFRPGVPLNSTDLQFGLTAGYEIDFWGKYARADEAARARLLSQSASRGTVLVALYANVAQTYFNLRAVDAQVALAEKTLATRVENLRLQQRRFVGGVVGELDVRQAQSEAASIEVSLRIAKQNQSNLASAMALLLGRQPGEIRNPTIARGADLAALYDQPTIPAALPSDLLNRRPDIVAAEQLLIASNADIALARTAYYPRLSLTAGIGQQSKDLGNLLNPASIFWNMIGNLAQPIFRAGAVDATVAAANAREKQAVAIYTQAVQSAFKDAHDAFNNIDANRDLVGVTQKRIEALRGALRLSDIRYKGGYSNYLEVLSAQRDLAQAEIALIDIQRSQLNAVVSLYKATGGGWDASSLTAVASGK
jgi:outer membrane protein, multidrug efflux system